MRQERGEASIHQTNANSRRLRTTLNFFQVSIKTLVIVSASIQISVFQLLKAQNPERVPYINILAERKEDT